MPFNDDIRELQKKIAVENDPHSFGQLYMGYMPNLFRFAQSIIKNRELAEEVVSAVFIKTWQNRKALAKIENFRLYLYKSVRNTSFNYSLFQ